MMPPETVQHHGLQGRIDRVARLSNEQRDVLFGIARGLKYQAIAHELGIVEATVKKRIARAIEILGTRDRAEAVALFAQWNEREKRYNRGIISPKFFDLQIVGPDASAAEEQPAQRLEDASIVETDTLPFLPERRLLPAPTGAQRHDLTTLLLRIAALAVLLIVALAGMRTIMETVSDWGLKLEHFFFS